jgi:hypothetical protein
VCSISLVWALAHIAAEKKQKQIAAVGCALELTTAGQKQTYKLETICHMGDLGLIPDNGTKNLCQNTHLN